MNERLALPALHAAWGAMLLWHPAPVLSALAGRPAHRRDRLLLRLLGARHLGQAAVTAAAPTPAVLAAGGAVDLLHALTCLGLAVTRPRWRHAAGLGCLSASAFAAAGFATARRHREQDAGGR